MIKAVVLGYDVTIDGEKISCNNEDALSVFKSVLDDAGIPAGYSYDLDGMRMKILIDRFGGEITVLPSVVSENQIY